MQPVLCVEHLHKRFDQRRVVDDVCLKVNPRQIVGLLGCNGAGKTTSFNMVAGLVPCDGGQVLLEGVCLSKMPLWQRVRHGLGYLPQETTVLRGLSARHNLWVALEAQGIYGARRTQLVSQALAEQHLEHAAEILGGQLSGGERRRLEMARALLRAPKVLLLDEPFAGVDPIAVSDIQAAIRKVRDQGIGVLITDHNVAETLRLCDHAYLIDAGRIVAQGSAQELIANPTARKVYLGQNFTL